MFKCAKLVVVLLAILLINVMPAKAQREGYLYKYQTEASCYTGGTILFKNLGRKDADVSITLRGESIWESQVKPCTQCYPVSAKVPRSTDAPYILHISEQSEDVTIEYECI